MAYAAAVSLWQILRQLQFSDQFSIVDYPKSQIQLLYDKVDFLKDFLEENSELESDFECQIRDSMYDAEDIIESHISSHYFPSSEYESQIFCQDLQRVILKLMISVQEVIKKKSSDQDLYRLQISPSLQRGRRSSSTPAKNLLFGRYKDFTQLMDRLTSGSASRLQVVPIVGVPGIGKTSLAQHLYHDQLIEKYFDIRAWITLSPEYQRRDTLLELLRSIKNVGDEMLQGTEDQLAKNVTKSLKGRRYLIVLDDILDVEAWNDLKELLPDDDNRSRVMLTTGKMDVADNFAVNGAPPHQLDFLKEDASRDLLSQTVIGEGESIYAIASNCRGLPAAIVTVGRLLSWASMTERKRVASTISLCKDQSELMKVIVSLSYKCLPQYLKACLLYLGIFPYNYEIPVSKLIKLWIAEGFLRPIRSRTFEEIAEDYLLQLVDRGLVSACQRRLNGRIKTCRLNQVFYDFVVAKAEEEKFFHVINKNTNGFLEDTDNQRRFCIHKNISFGVKDATEYNSMASVSTVRSLLYTGPQHLYPQRVWLEFKLLRVLDALKIRFYSFPSVFLKLACLRYLAFSYNGELPASICELRSLQFLIVLRYLSMKHTGLAAPHLPMEIWNMKELRHLQFMGSDLPDLSENTEDGRNGYQLLENLLILLDVSAQSCAPQILRRVPNLNKLGVRIVSSSQDAAETFSFFSHLDILRQLESFKCVVMHPDLGSPLLVSSLPVPAFPLSLRKLTLSGCGFTWENMMVIGSLPNLKVLKLRSYAFQGPQWETVEGEFPQLNFLLLEDMDLERWLSESTHFPTLSCLIIRHCYKLREIPSEIGEIPTLEMIELVDCSPSAMNSALQIKEEQMEFGNEDIQVNIYSSRDD